MAYINYDSVYLLGSVHFCATETVQVKTVNGKNATYSARFYESLVKSLGNALKRLPVLGRTVEGAA